MDLTESHPLADLTDKQREVLDRLIEHKTSKEIARELRISPHTVDQRIQFAKEKLGASTRSEAAVLYRRLVEAYERMTYENSGVARPMPPADDAARERVSAYEILQPDRTRSDSTRVAEADYQVVLGLFDGRHAALMRLGAITVIALLLMLLLLGALGILMQLSRLIAQGGP